MANASGQQSVPMKVKSNGSAENLSGNQAKSTPLPATSPGSSKKNKFAGRGYQPSARRGGRGGGGAQAALAARGVMPSRSKRAKQQPSTGVKVLEELEYYHGFLPKEHAEELCTQQGEFLLRKSKDKTGLEIMIVLTCKWESKSRHIRITEELNKRFRIDKKEFDSVADLIDYYKIKSEPFGKCQAILMNPVPKQEWELAHSQIKLDKKIGEGAFGEVYLGELSRNDVLNTREKPIKVAVKRSKEQSELTRDQIRDIMGEAKVQMKFKHKNVVAFLGVAANEPPVMIVLEYVANGALNSYLKKSTEDIPKVRLIKMSHGCACGIEYLHSQECIHRDIAARNFLVDEQETVKITDFGLTKQGTNQYKLGANEKVPIKWAAIETLTSKVFTFKTDVWSYGVLLWEIFNQCKTEPYPEMNAAEVKDRIKNNPDFRMPPPIGMPDKISTLMTSCWQKDPAIRPDFKQIKIETEKILAELKENK